MILNDDQIRASLWGSIDPFSHEKVRKITGVPVLSFGVESFGYTISLGNEFLVAPSSHLVCENGVCQEYVLDWFNGLGSEVRSELPALDVKNPRTFELMKHIITERVIIPPNSFILGKSMEHFDMPYDIVGMAVGKSTYARAGLSAIITPLEPGWQGYLTVEIANLSGFPAALYAFEGVAQIMFFRGEMPSSTYDGNYQGQENKPVPPIV